MKTLYFECNMGAAGDMLMAALLELLPDKGAFLDKINNLGISGVRVSAEPSVKCGITGTHITVTVNGEEESDHTHENHHHDHTHSGHHHSHNSYHDIEHLIDHLNVSDTVKKNVLEVYKLIAEAESYVHGVSVDKIHFHEVGEMDALADITGVCMLIEELAPDVIMASPVNTGSGHVRCAHGVLPVPAPATARILTDVPIYGGEIKGELCTPTGAAILKYFADDFGSMPQMRVSKTGYGMGRKDFEAANCVRVFMGVADVHEGGPNGYAAELRCNVDDMTGEAIGFACQTLMEAGARDVFTTAADMKKDRPGVLFTCVCDEEKADMFASLMLKHTTTFGVRKAVLDRYTLEREVTTRQTPFGAVRLKTGKGYGVIKYKLEYNDVAALAKKHGCSVAEMERHIWNNLKSQDGKE